MLGRITDFLAGAGCAFPAIDLLQPADPFLDTTGEDLRRRIFMTRENSGAALCLRPEFTVPVCLHYLQTGKAQGRYGYGGTVFRQRVDAPAEFVQAGYEDLGNPDRNKADIECINMAASLLDECDITGTQLVIGDQSAFTTVLRALEIPDAWRKKLLRSFGDKDRLKDQIEGMSEAVQSDVQHLSPQVQSALKAADPALLTDLVAERMIADGLPLTGGRTPGAIAERMLEKTVLGTSRLAPEKRRVLEEFLDLDLELEQAADAMADFEKRHRITLPDTAQNLARLAEAIRFSGRTPRYSASFGRRLDYYTGMVFEIYRAAAHRPVIGGGRYDHLLTLLGSRREIPAVGFAVWVDRLEETP